MALAWTAFQPAALKEAWKDSAGNLKSSCTTSSYTGGNPTAAADLKPSIVDHATGNLKEGLVHNDQLKSSLTP